LHDHTQYQLHKALAFEILLFAHFNGCLFIVSIFQAYERLYGNRADSFGRLQPYLRSCAAFDRGSHYAYEVEQDGTPGGRFKRAFFMPSFGKV
jgi:hypothetical protein